jgi:hypothetical protein
MPRAVSIAAFALLLLAPASAATQEQTAAPGPLRVLFVGNSLTSTNDLPARVAELAASTGRALEVGEVVFDGFSLEDHWNQGDARRAIASGTWDVVVMQQGPSALPESQVNLRAWAIRWADEASKYGTKPALLTVWPESYRKGALVDVIASYRRAARAAGAELLPAGDAWRLAWRCEPRLPLYGPDGFHPGSLGTYAAALVVYGRLFHAPIVEKRGTHNRRLVQKAAARSLGRPVVKPCAA